MTMTERAAEHVAAAVKIDQRPARVRACRRQSLAADSREIEDFDVASLGGRHGAVLSVEGSPLVLN